MNIDIIQSPKNKTSFNAGDRLSPIKDSGVWFKNDEHILVVGEDHKYVHTFGNITGMYCGIFKRKENLESFEILDVSEEK